jgi:hypothetical protein
MSKVYPSIPKMNNDYTLELDTTPNSASYSWVEVQGSFKTINISRNETQLNESKLSDDGYGSTIVTGQQVRISLSGTRYYGDAGQDYIFSDTVVNGIGATRFTTAKLTYPDGTIYQCPATIVNPVDAGGDAANPSSCSVEIHLNGRPVVTTADSTNLATLSITGVDISPVFSANVNQYTASTSDATNVVTATAADAGATVSITNGGTTVTSGSSATWSEGLNILTIVVTNDGVSEATTILVTYSNT